MLHFFNNMSGNGGAKAVAAIVRASPHLEDLRFSSTRGGHEGGMALAEAIGTLTTLRRLDLNDNTFGPDVGVALGRALAHQRSLEVVNLGDTSTWPAVLWRSWWCWARELLSRKGSAFARGMDRGGLGVGVVCSRCASVCVRQGYGQCDAVLAWCGVVRA